MSTYSLHTASNQKLEAGTRLRKKKRASIQLLVLSPFPPPAFDRLQYAKMHTVKVIKNWAQEGLGMSMSSTALVSFPDQASSTVHVLE